MRVLNECNEWEKIFSQWEEENPDLAKQLVEYETSKYKVEYIIKRKNLYKIKKVEKFLSSYLTKTNLLY
jgi:hypothetical protein